MAFTFQCSRGWVPTIEATTSRPSKKPEVFSPNYSLPPLLTVPPSDLETSTIQPAFSSEPVPLGGYAWFVAKGPAEPGRGGLIVFRCLEWDESIPRWAGPWTSVSDTAPSYRDYFDVPQADSTFRAPHSGGTVLIGNTGSRLMTAVIRNGHLWTCHHVGVVGSTGSWDGTAPADRSAVQWFRLELNSESLRYRAHGRIYDPSPTEPYWYYFPSLNVDPLGNTIFAFSGAKAGEHIAAFFSGRRADGAIMSSPVLIQAGRVAKINDRWGDYSATTIDPHDGSFWTVQQYGHLDTDPDWGGPVWGTWIMQIKAAP